MLVDILPHLCQELKSKAIGFSETISQGDIISGHSDNQVAHNYWSTLDDICTKLLHECNKISLAIQESNEIQPSHYQSLFSSLDITLSAFFCQISGFVGGKYLRKHLISKVSQSLVVFIDWLDVLVEYHSNRSENYLVLVGKLWEIITSIKVCPKTEIQAVSILIDKEYPLICDALEEVTHDLNIHEENDEETQSHEILGTLINYIKSAKSLLKKLKQSVEKCDKNIDIQCSESLGDNIIRMSSEIDDIIIDVGPPLNKSEILDKVDKLKQTLVSLLEQARSGKFTSESDIQWIEFMSRAIAHNHLKVSNKLKEMIDS